MSPNLFTFGTIHTNWPLQYDKFSAFNLGSSFIIKYCIQIKLSKILITHWKSISARHTDHALTHKQSNNDVFIKVYVKNVFNVNVCYDYE